MSKKGEYKRVSEEDLSRSVPGCTLGKDGSFRNPHFCYGVNCKRCGWFAQERDRRIKLLRQGQLTDKGYGGVKYLAIPPADLY